MAGEFFNFFHEDYRFVLDDFEGPLDLLLKMIKDKDMDILTVKLADLTDQYLKYMQDIDEIDLDRATDFLVTASSMLEIKSHSLLPKLPIEFETEEFDPEEKLRQRLIEYDLFKQKSEEIKERETTNRFYTEPVFTEDDAIITIKDFNMEKLMDAYAKLLLKYSAEKEIIPEKKIQKDRFTVKDKIVLVANLLRARQKIRFSELFDSDYSKGEIINTFLALLELLKRQYASATQEDWKHDIYIEYKESDEDISLLDLEIDSIAEEG